MKGILPNSIVYRKKSPYPKTHNPIYMDLVAKKVKEILQNKDLPINNLISKEGVLEIIENPESIKSPWYGQLMGPAQVLAYILQMNCWLKEYNIIF